MSNVSIGPSIARRSPAMSDSEAGGISAADFRMELPRSGSLSLCLPLSPRDLLEPLHQPAAALGIEPCGVRDAAGQVRAEVGHAGAVLPLQAEADAVAQ